MTSPSIAAPTATTHNGNYSSTLTANTATTSSQQSTSSNTSNINNQSSNISTPPLTPISGTISTPTRQHATPSNKATQSNSSTPTNNQNNSSSNNNNWSSNSRFSIGSIKSMIESAEIGQMTDEAALFMSNLVTQKLRDVIREAEKFCFHSRRRKLLTKDVDFALKLLNMQPILGFYCSEIIPFRFATGGGHRIYYYDDKEIELADVIARVNIPKLPQEVAIEQHWLAIDGVQPAIPENPPPLDRDEQKLECVDPLESLQDRAFRFGSRGDQYGATRMRDVEFGSDGRILNDGDFKKNYRPILYGRANTNVLKKHVETVQIKQLATHELSVEQQLYYKEITEACVGSIEARRLHALNSLSHDPGLHQMLPRLCTFISEGVKVNVVHNNLALLIYLMRMVKALLENQSLYLEKYLHELVPTVITCIVSKQICNRPEQENHYALRDFTCKLLANICKTYNTSTNCLQTRITKLLCKALDNPNLPLSSVYGCISALCELGPEVQQALLSKRIKMIHDRIRSSASSSSTTGSPERHSPASPEGKILSLLQRAATHIHQNQLKQ